MIRFRLGRRMRAGIPPKPPATFLLSAAKMDRRYLPGRGLVYSFLVHEIVFFGMLFLSVSGRVTAPARPPLQVIMINLKEPFYLPILLGGGARPTTVPRAELAAAPKKLPGPGAKGLSYPGPQPIVSDFPQPTNRVQTVLQPARQNLPTLHPPLLLPNLVQIADPGPVPQVEPAASAVKAPDPVIPVEQQTAGASPAPAVKVSEPPLPLVKLAPPPQIEAPKVVLPQRAALNTATSETKPAVPSLKTEPPEQLTASPPSPPENHPVPKDIRPPALPPKPVEPILVLSPMPAPPQQVASIPVGEARGRFAISPEPNPAASETEPGGKAGTSPSDAGVVSRTEVPAANVAPVAAGTVPIAGAKTATASRAGAGKAPFAGITVFGGVAGNRTASNAAAADRNPPPPQTSYNTMIISTETSGGGLPRFGVFPNQEIYTVYLDMRRTNADPAPRWIFEYAVLQGTSVPPNAAKPSASLQERLVLPFPVMKERPALPADVVRRYLRQLVIVYGILNIDGKIEQMSVKESPDAVLNEGVLAALAKWVFRPAQLDGEAIPVKVLLGIPLALQE